jgi:hypothetical protein
MDRYKDITGKIYNKLTVIKKMPNKQGRTMWLCKCICGNEIITRGESVRSGHTKSCGCIKSLSKGLASMRSIIIRYKKSAKRRGYNYNLTEEQFKEITQKDCYYCGAKPKQISKGKKSTNGTYTYNGIDRIDNTKGYAIDNIVPCCLNCNTAKGTKTIQEFKEWVRRLNNKIFSKDVMII